MVTPTSLNGTYWALAVPAARVDATKSPAITVLMNTSLYVVLACFGGTHHILAHVRKLVRPTPTRWLALLQRPLICARCERTGAIGGRADTAPARSNRHL